MRVVAPAGLIAQRYRLLSPLGSGSSATVWAAADETLGRQVALKLLSVTAAADEGEREHLRREARALAALTHPNIIVVFDFLEAPGLDGAVQPVLITELLEGRSLAARLASGPLRWREALSVCGQLAAALAAAHRAGIVHRDVAPGNVMLTGSGVKLLDFGIAQATTADAGGGGAGGVDADVDVYAVGTPVCMAPEQLTGHGALPASDVYALGCVLHWCLTGRPPYRDKDIVWLSNAHLRAEPPSLTVAGLPEGINELYLACLAKDPDERPTAEQAAAALVPFAPAATAAAMAALGPAPSGERSQAEDDATEVLPMVVSAGVAEYEGGSSNGGAAAGVGADAESSTDAATSTATGAQPPRFSPGRHAGTGRALDRRRLLPAGLLLGAFAVVVLLIFGLSHTLTDGRTSANRTTSAATSSATATTATSATVTATVGSVILPNGSAGAPTSALASSSSSATASSAASASASPSLSASPIGMATTTAAIPALPDPAGNPLGYVQALGNQVQALVTLGPATLQPDAGQRLLNSLGVLQNDIANAQQHPGNKQWRNVATAITGIQQQISNDASAGQVSTSAANLLVDELQSLSSVLPAAANAAGDQ